MIARLGGALAFGGAAAVALATLTDALLRALARLSREGQRHG